MKANLEDFGTGWHGVAISLNTKDIEQLIANLEAIKSNPNQHFHYFSDYSGPSGIGDIEFNHDPNLNASNMQVDILAKA